MMKPSEDMDRTRTFSTWVRRVVDENGDAEDQPTSYSPSRAATVATIMTRMTYCVRPEVSIETLASLLLDHRMSGVPVVNEEGQPVGVVSKTDLLRHLHERGDTPETEETRPSADIAALGPGFHATRVDVTKVADIMMPVVFAIEQDVRIVEAAALMAGEGVHRLAVVDDKLAVIGIVSTLDVVRWVAENAGFNV
jgi:CBS domain-containing protein